MRANGKTAVFITHHIGEAMEIGDRIFVCHRPARVAFEARLDSGAGRLEIQEKILQVLSIDKPASAATAKE